MEDRPVKKPAALIVFLTLPAAALAQQQATTPKMECRDISTSGNVVFSNEIFINGKACHVADAKPSAVQSPPAAAAKPQPQQSQLQQSQPQPASSQSAASTPAAQQVPVSMRINGGSYVYIAPMDGFETYMIAALRKKDVPLEPIEDISRANYVLKGASQEDEKTGGWVKVASMGKIHSDATANIRLIDRLTGAIVFAYEVNKKNTLHGQQTAAEDCAKHLKTAIDK
jgi:hypothetical protein